MTVGYSRILGSVSKFILQPARLLQTRLVTSKMGEPIELEFVQLLAKMVPNRDRIEAMKLMGLRRGMFIGLTQSAKTPGKQVVFVLYNPEGGGNVDFVLKEDPTFEQRMLEAYRVEEATYDAVITETPTLKVA